MRLKKGDLFILIVIVLALISYFGIKTIYKDIENKAVVIYVDGIEYDRIYLNSIKEEQLIHIDLKNEKFIDINVSNDGVHVSDVICPDRICVKTGFINKVGQSIVCLPNKVQIYIEGGMRADVDGVSY